MTSRSRSIIVISLFSKTGMVVTSQYSSVRLGGELKQAVNEASLGNSMTNLYERVFGVVFRSKVCPDGIPNHTPCSSSPRNRAGWFQCRVPSYFVYRTNVVSIL